MRGTWATNGMHMPRAKTVLRDKRNVHVRCVSLPPSDGCWLPLACAEPLAKHRKKSPHPRGTATTLARGPVQPARTTKLLPLTCASLALRQLAGARPKSPGPAAENIQPVARPVQQAQCFVRSTGISPKTEVSIIAKTARIVYECSSSRSLSVITSKKKTNNESAYHKAARRVYTQNCAGNCRTLPKE